MVWKRIFHFGLAGALLMVGSVPLHPRPASAATLFDDFYFLPTPALYSDIVGSTENPGHLFIGPGAKDVSQATSVSVADLKNFATSHVGISALVQRLFSAGASLEQGSLRFSDVQINSASITTANSLVGSNVANNTNVVLEALTVDSISANVCSTKEGGLSIGATVPLKPMPGVPTPSASASTSPSPSESPSPTPTPAPSASPSASPSPGTTVTSATNTTISPCPAATPDPLSTVKGTGNAITLNLGGTQAGRTDVTFSGAKMVIAVKVYRFTNDANRTYDVRLPDKNNLNGPWEFIEDCNGPCGGAVHSERSQYWLSISSPDEDQMTKWKIGSSDTYCVILSVIDNDKPGPDGGHLEAGTVYCPSSDGQINDSNKDTGYRRNRRYIRTANLPTISYLDGQRWIVGALDIAPSSFKYDSDHFVTTASGKFTLRTAEYAGHLLHSLP